MSFTVKIDVTQVAAEDIQIAKKHNEVTLAQFKVPNTPANRVLVGVDKDCTIDFNATNLFSGTHMDPAYGDESILCRAVDKVCEKMARTLYSKAYVGVAANTILSEICAAAGVTAGSCPTTAVSITYEYATCLHAARTLAFILGLDWWTTLGTTFNIGTNGVALGAQTLYLGTHDQERSKKRDKITVKGYDDSGNEIVKTAGSGTREYFRLDRTAKDGDTVQAVANSLLAQLNMDTSSFPAWIDVNTAKTWKPDDTVTLSDSQRNASGNYRIAAWMLRGVQVELSLVKIVPTVEGLLSSLGIFSEELGVLPPPALPAGSSVTADKIVSGTFGDNVILNPSAETGVQGWQVTEGSGTVAQSSDDKTEGAYSFKTSAPICGVGCYAFAMVPGDKYVVRMKIRGLSATGSGLYIRVNEKQSSPYPQMSFVTAGNRDSYTDLLANAPVTLGWTEYAFVYTVSSNRYWGTVEVLNNTGGPTNLYIDEVECRKQIGSAQLESGSVITSTIGDAQVTHDKLADNAIETHNIKDDNVTVAKLDEYRETATITAGNTSVTVTHNLGHNPTHIAISPIDDLGLDRRWWVSTISTTTIVITISSSDTSNHQFAVGLM